MIPIIIGVGISASAGYGIGKGLSGKADIDEANAIVENAREQHELALKYLQDDFAEVNRLAEIYGQLQIRVKLNTIKRFISILNRINQNSTLDEKYLKSLGISKPELEELKISVIESEDFVNSNTFSTAASSAGIAIGAAQAFGTVSTTRFFGLWTTEVAVSKLAGANAWRGILNWFGGGSVAMGGLALGGITLAPMLMISAYQIASKGEKALTDAYEYESKVVVAIEQIQLFQEFLVGVYERIKELGKLVHKLEQKANILLDKIESPSYLYPKEIYLKIHGKELQSLTMIIKVISEIIKTPILDNNANKLNTKSFKIYEKYNHIY